jgi:hypothetical protein
MVELVDTLDSKSSSGNRVGVQVPLPLPFLARGCPLTTLLIICSTVAYTFQIGISKEIA